MVTGDPVFLCKASKKKFKSKGEMLAVLLHECGHVEGFLSGSFQGEISKLPPHGKKPKDFWYIEWLREEFDAWKRAEKIAAELKILGLKAALKKMKERCLMAYVEWVHSRGDINFLYPAVNPPQVVETRNNQNSSFKEAERSLK